jgi:uncharacterized membrane protein
VLLFASLNVQDLQFSGIFIRAETKRATRELRSPRSIMKMQDRNAFRVNYNRIFYFIVAFTSKYFSVSVAPRTRIFTF